MFVGETRSLPLKWSSVQVLPLRCAPTIKKVLFSLS
jgi:hypothetical protein